MRKPMHQRILTGLLLIGIILACNLPPTQTPQPETETPVPPSSPTETETLIPTERPTNTAIPASTELVVLDTATPKFAPFCEPSSASVATPVQCELPIAEQSSVFCVKKIPYNLILINAGSTYETLSEDIECSDAGRKNGKQMLTCTGPMALSFELRVCDPSCAIPTFQAETTHCPQDYNYNDFFGCCEQQPHPIDANCVVLKLQTKSCVVDCSEFTEETTCNKNAYACYWDTTNDVCLVRN